MFQKWLIAFLADRSWRYLQNRRTRKQLGRTIEKRAQRSAKQVRQARERSGFKPGRALTLLALGAGAYAYFRSRQQSAWNDQFSMPTQNASNPTDLTTSAAATAATPVTASTTEPDVSAPYYNTTAAAPATTGDTAMLAEVDTQTLAPDAEVDPLAPQADAPTYAAQATPDQSDTLAVPATEQDADEARAPTYNTQASLAESTLAVPATEENADEPVGAADADALNEEAATNAATTTTLNRAAPKEAPDDQRI